MVNEVGADAMIAMMNAKYHFLFWRPVTAIDPTSVTNDGFGPVPGFDDGNPATVEQPGWRPLVATPNHPEYPSAHATITSAIAEVLTHFLGTDAIDVDVQGTPDFTVTRHFATADDLRAEADNARVWAGELGGIFVVGHVGLEIVGGQVRLGAVGGHVGLEVVGRRARDLGRGGVVRARCGAACGFVGHRWSFPHPVPGNRRRRPAPGGRRAGTTPVTRTNSSDQST